MKCECKGMCIDTISGYCPVQAFGRFNGLPFYFRARGNQWMLGVGATDEEAVEVAVGLGDGTNRYDGDWGETPFGADYMPDATTLGIIYRCYEEYRRLGDVGTEEA